MKIRWINLAKGEGRDNAGNWESVERRFSISPVYAGRVYPIWYQIEDRITGRKWSRDTVRDCKNDASQIVQQERA